MAPREALFVKLLWPLVTLNTDYWRCYIITCTNQVLAFTEDINVWTAANRLMTNPSKTGIGGPQISHLTSAHTSGLQVIYLLLRRSSKQWIIWACYSTEICHSSLALITWPLAATAVYVGLRAVDVQLEGTRQLGNLTLLVWQVRWAAHNIQSATRHLDCINSS